MIRRIMKMLKRIALGMALALLLLGMLTVTSKANPDNIATVASHPGPYYKVDPENTTKGPDPAIDEAFKIEIKLYNVTVGNVPNGLLGVEVWLTWNSTLVQPLNFTNKLGASGGVFNGSSSILYAINPDFYNATPPHHSSVPAPYDDARYYLVSGATLGSPWWGDGDVAEIWFKVIFQPQLGDPDIHDFFNFTFTDLVDSTAAQVLHEYEDGNYTVTIPEFSPTIILMILTLFTLFAVALRKTKLHKRV
jgi:hypothetical protein